MDIQPEKFEEDLLSKPPQSRLFNQTREEEKKNAWMERQIISPYQLKFLLLGMTKDELDEVRRTLAVRNASSLKKQKLVAKLMDVIPMQAAEIFATFDEERYRLLQKLVKSGGIIYDPHFSQNIAKYLRKHGMAFVGNHKGRKAIIMPEEIITAFEQAAGPELDWKIRRNTQWVRLTQGMLFYYGVLDFSEAKDRLEELTGERINALEYINVISSAAECYSQMKHTLSGVAQGRVLNPEAVKKKRQARTDLDYYRVSIEQLLRAAMPEYMEQTPALLDFTQFLCGPLNLSQGIAREVVKNVLDIISEDGSVEELLKYLTECLELQSAQMVEVLRANLQELFIHTRRWTLKGHTIQEVKQWTAVSRRSRSGQMEDNIIDFPTGKTGKTMVVPTTETARLG